eukprot:6196256-Pleurochrysis_carterae.AAC.1
MLATTTNERANDGCDGGDDGDDANAGDGHQLPLRATALAFSSPRGAISINWSLSAASASPDFLRSRWSSSPSPLSSPSPCW